MSYCGSLRASGEASHHHNIFFTVFDDVPLWMKTACAAFYDFNPNVTHRLASTLLGPNQESEPSFLAAGRKKHNRRTKRLPPTVCDNVTSFGAGTCVFVDQLDEMGMRGGLFLAPNTYTTALGDDDTSHHRVSGARRCPP